MRYVGGKMADKKIQLGYNNDVEPTRRLFIKLEKKFTSIGPVKNKLKTFSH
jgi:hypothetical protein